MKNTTTEKITDICKAQKEYFKTGATLDVEFRKEMLGTLLQAMQTWDGK